MIQCSYKEEATEAFPEGEAINKRQCLHKMEYYAVLKKKTLIHVGSNTEHITLIK